MKPLFQIIKLLFELLGGIYNWHRRHCRITPGSVLVYLTPELLAIFAPPRMRHPDFTHFVWEWGLVLLKVTAIGVGIWLTKGVFRKGLALVDAGAWIGAYAAPLFFHTSFNYLGFWAGCFWITTYVDGQDSVRPATWRDDRE